VPRTVVAHPAESHSTLALAPVVRIAARYGIAAEALLRGSAIDVDALTDPEARITFEEESAILERLVAKVPERLLAIEIGRAYHLSTFGLLGAAAAAVTTAAELVELFVGHLDRTYTPFAVALDRDPTSDGSSASIRVRYLDVRPLGALRQFYLERDVAFVIATCRRLFGTGFVRQIDLDDPIDGAEARTLARAFGHPVRFGRDVAAVWFDPAAAAARSDGDPVVLRALEGQLRAGTSAAVEAPEVVAKVRRLLADRLARARTIPDLEAIARALSTSPRTLRRQLTGADTSFRALLDEVLAARAIRLLEGSDASIDEVAARVGYAEAASFIRAFRRWTGETPEAFRGRTR
jgi:AraC-like DNA-binding protein